MPTPTSQLLSRTLYSTDGTTTVWDFSFSGGYLDKSHIKAFVETPDGARTEVVVTAPMVTGPFQLTITPALAAGSVLTIYRDTPKDLPLVDFTDESGFSEISLDTNAKQAVFIAAETIDTLNTSNTYDAEQAAAQAAAAASAASASAVSAASSLDAFDDRYLGSKAVAPTLDNDGNALVGGALYWNSNTNTLNVWSGSAWAPIAAPLGTGAYDSETTTATGGQTVITTATAYSLGTNTLSVYLNGLLMIRGADYTETTANSFTFLAGLTAGDEVVAQIWHTAIAPTGDASTTAYLPAGTGAVPTTVQSKLRESVSVKDFGAVGDGIADDLAAFTLALAASDYVYVPPGTYRITDTIYLGGSADAGLASILKRGKKLIGAGSFATKIVAATGFSANYMVFVGNSNYMVDGDFVLNNEVSGILLDNAAMNNTTSTYALYTMGTYNNNFRDLQLSYCMNPATRWDFSCANGTYTTNFYDCHFSQGQISSSTQGDVTTINFYGCSGTFLNIVNAVAINFDHYTSQGSPTVGYPVNRIQIATSANVSFMNGDIEGDGVMFNIFNSIGVKIEGNNVATPGSYTNGGTVTNVFCALNGGSQVTSKHNVFMNWLSGPASPTPGTYATYAGTNRKLQLLDFSGDTYTGAVYATSSTQALPDNVATIINYDTTVFDSGKLVINGFPTYSSTNLVTTGAAWKFNAPVYGVYAVNASVLIAGFVAATDYAHIAVYVNGVEKLRAWNTAPVFNTHQFLSVSGDVLCAPTDYIQIVVTCDAAAARALSSASTVNTCTIKYVGNY